MAGYYNTTNMYGHGLGHGHPYQMDDYKYEKNEVEDEIIVNFALLYGGFILVYGFGGFYWWTVIRRWANKKANEVMPYQGPMGTGNRSDMGPDGMAGDGMGGGYYDD